jgi:hypothetical protein
MAGRKGYTPLEFVALLSKGTLGAEMERHAAAGNWASYIATAKRDLSRMKSTANRAAWRRRTARRASTLAKVWRDFDRAFRAAGLPWCRHRLGPGAWSVRCQDPSGAWIEAVCVSAPIPRDFNDAPHVRIEDVGTVTLTDGRTLQIQV